MPGKSAEELRRVQSHLFLLIAMRVIFPEKGDAFSINIEQAVVTDSNAVGITAKIAEHQGWGAECRLCVYYPLLLEE